MGVIGPLGSGKSTLLAALTGEINKVEGTISMSNIEGGESAPELCLTTKSLCMKLSVSNKNKRFGCLSFPNIVFS